jgi:dihydrofolate reductase
MRKLILSLHVTPDGFCNHDAAVVGEDWMRYINDLAEQMGTAVFGRVTYQLFEQYWPQAAKDRSGPAEMVRFADLIDKMEKVVFSKTLPHTDWGNTMIREDLNKAVIDEIKAQQGKDIIVFGGPRLISELILLDAFDEYYIAIQPLLAGSGHRLFSTVNRGRLALELVDTTNFSGGVVLLHYRAKKRE